MVRHNAAPDPARNSGSVLRQCAAHQPFGIAEIALAAFGRLVGMRLRQMQSVFAFQCCQTGFQYCAVDSITASFTSVPPASGSETQISGVCAELRFSNGTRPLSLRL